MAFHRLAENQNSNREEAEGGLHQAADRASCFPERCDRGNGALHGVVEGEADDFEHHVDNRRLGQRRDRCLPAARISHAGQHQHHQGGERCHANQNVPEMTGFRLRAIDVLDDRSEQFADHAGDDHGRNAPEDDAHDGLALAGAARAGREGAEDGEAEQRHDRDHGCQQVGR